MSVFRITDLPAASAANLTDLLEKTNDPSGTPTSQKLSITQLKALFDTIYQAIGGGFSSTAVDFSNSFTLYTFAHSLGAVPKSVYAVMVNQSTNLGYAAGAEVDIHGVFSTSSGTEQYSLYADATNVYVSLREAMPAAAADVKLTPAAGGVGLSPDFTKWKLKVYAKI